MLYPIAADFIVFLHFCFIVFVLIGGFLVFKWHWLIWLHIPAAIWGALIVMVGWVCPLTPIENMLRQASGGMAYSGSFIERYLVPVIYPSALNREIFIAMGVFVIVINMTLYAIYFVYGKKEADSQISRRKK